MKKFLKRLFTFVLCVVLAILLVQFVPNLYIRLFGAGNARWISERFSETLREKNELVVYEVETTGQETVAQDAWLLGTVQKVEMPYRFTMSYTVDLSQAQVSVKDNMIELRIPSPKPGYQKLSVEEERVRKVDWLYPLTPERYSQIKLELEEKLFHEYSTSDEYKTNAWNVAVHNLEGLFQSVAQESILGIPCEIEIIQDDHLNPDTITLTESTSN